MSNWPRYTIVIALSLTLVFGIQIAHTPATCSSADYPAFCTAGDYLPSSFILALLLMPFFHGTAEHFVTNAVLFLVFGTAIERWHGRNPFLFVFFLGCYLSTALQVWRNFQAGNPPVDFGISGGAFALGGFLLVMYFPTSRKAINHLSRAAEIKAATSQLVVLCAGLYVVGKAILEYGGILQPDPMTAVLSHLIGVLFGIGTALYLRVT